MSNEELINSLNYISSNWNIPQEIYDLHIGKRNDLSIHELKVNQVIFHIPKLSDINQYVLWDCLWPDCHNCCNKQGRLPLTKDDLFQISKSLGYDSPNHFIKDETKNFLLGGSRFFRKHNKYVNDAFIKKKTK